MRTLLFFSLLPFVSYAQVVFNAGNALPASASVAAEFGSGNLGLVLPYVNGQSAVASPANGTLIYDAASGAGRVKIYENNSWRDLSLVSAPLPAGFLTEQNNRTEDAAARVTIGTETATTPSGILVFEDTDKVLVLPKVAAPYQNIVSPAPGTVAYDTVMKQLAVFNGTVWTFWE